MKFDWKIKWLYINTGRKLNKRPNTFILCFILCYLEAAVLFHLGD